MRLSRASKLLAAFAAAFLVCTLGSWYLITQPLFTTLPSPELPRAVDVEMLRKHVQALSMQFVPRDWEHPKNLARASSYIRDEFVRAGGDVAYQRYDMEGNEYRNVVARFGPMSGEQVVVGAHYDAAEALPGADDNASGVAGLIELAYLLGATTLRSRVELVAFTLEEPKNPGEPGLFRTPFGGSAVHARSLKQGAVTLKAALILEMIGFFSDEEDSQDLPSSFLKPFYPSKGDFIAVVGKLSQVRVVRTVKAAMRSASPLPVYSLSAFPAIGNIDWSDHYNYWKLGYPAVMITDTSFYRNKSYHTAGDTPDQLDYERMRMVVQGVYAAVLRFSEEAASR